MEPLERLTRIFNQDTDLEYASMEHAALTGLVAGRLQGLVADQPIVNAVGNANAAGIPLIFNGGQRYVIVILPLDD